MLTLFPFICCCSLVKAYFPREGKMLSVTSLSRTRIGQAELWTKSILLPSLVDNNFFGNGHTHLYIVYGYFRGFSGGSAVEDSACNAGDPGLIPGFGRSPGEGNGNPHRGAWKLQFVGSQRVRHDWAANTFTFMVTLTVQQFKQL